MQENVPAAGELKVLGLRIERELMIRAMEFGGILLALFVTRAGVQLLEDKQHITQGVVYFVIGTLILVLVTWRLRQRDNSAALTLPALNAAKLRQPGQLARDLAGSWQAIGWWALLIVAISLGFTFRLRAYSTPPCHPPIILFCRAEERKL